MEIIMKGQLPGERLYRKSCANCGTVFEFKQAETRLSNSTDQRDAGTRYIKCPLGGCNTEALVFERDRKVEDSHTKPAPSLVYPPGVRDLHRQQVGTPRGGIAQHIGDSHITYGSR